jgi:hypothetical protein
MITATWLLCQHTCWLLVREPHHRTHVDVGVEANAGAVELWRCTCGRGAQRRASVCQDFTKQVQLQLQLETDTTSVYRSALQSIGVYTAYCTGGALYIDVVYTIYLQYCAIINVVYAVHFQYCANTPVLFTQSSFSTLGTLVLTMKSPHISLLKMNASCMRYSQWGLASRTML